MAELKETSPRNTQLELQADEARMPCRLISGFTGLGNEKFANDGHWQEEMFRVVEKCYEPELFVEVASGIVDGIDFDRANAKLFCKALGSSQNVDQKQGTEPLSLYATVNREPPEQDHRYIDPR